MDDIKDLINRANQLYGWNGEIDFFKEKKEKDKKWRIENPDVYQESVKKYEKSEKGQTALKRRNAKRYQREKNAWQILTKEEKREIKEFYRNCPEGYEIDHIIPLIHGGSSRLDNLQYLKIAEHRLKHATRSNRDNSK